VSSGASVEDSSVMTTTTTVAAEEEEVDPLQVRNSKYEYTLLRKIPTKSYLSVVMMKESDVSDGKPREKTMLQELQRDDAGDHVAVFVSVGLEGGASYTDFKTLTYNLHGKQSREQRNECMEAAEEGGVATLSIPGGASYLSNEVNVLYEGTPEYERLVGEFGQEPYVGDFVQFLDQFVDSRKYDAAYARKQIEGRGTVQRTIGISNHNYANAKPAEEGEVAAVDVQGEKELHRYCPDRGRGLGEALARLATVRDALTRERGGHEYDDELRNQVFSGRAGQIFGVLEGFGFESVTISLTGQSLTLEEMMDKLLEKLPPAERAEARARWAEGGGAVETKDHGDGLNPKEAAYSRVVLFKWFIHLTRDREGDVLVVTLIGNHRASVATYEVKMKGIRALSRWYKETVEARAAEEGEGHVPYDADGDFLSHGASVLRLGFVEDEINISGDSLTKSGPGGFVSYSRPLLTPGGPAAGGAASAVPGWQRHRKTILQPGGEAAAATPPSKGGRKRGRKRKRTEIAAAAAAAAAPPSEEEVNSLQLHARLYGELIFKRGDYNRFADLSGCIWVTEQVRDRFELDDTQAREMTLCIMWHAKSRAVYLLKCQALLDREGEWAAAFGEVARKGRRHNAPRGGVGHYIMEEMIDSKRMGRMATELMRVTQGHIVWKTNQEGSFTANFVAQEEKKLKGFLRAAEKLNPKVTTTAFLQTYDKSNDSLTHVSSFILPQVLPVSFLLGLYKGAAWRAAEAPILDPNKAHYKEFIKLGVDPEFFDLSMRVVALQFGTVPLGLEHTGCEKFRRQRNVHDFMVPGQMFYGMRPVPGCNYKSADFVVYVKKWGPEGRWVPAVRDAQGRWRHP